jgi:hypothetical protein
VELEMRVDQALGDLVEHYDGRRDRERHAEPMAEPAPPSVRSFSRHA